MSWGGEQQTEVARTCYENGYLPPTGSSDHKFSSTNVLLVPQYTSAVTWCLVTTVNLACGGYVNTDKLTTWTRTVPTLYFTLKLVQWSLTAKAVTKVTMPKWGGGHYAVQSLQGRACARVPPSPPVPPPMWTNTLLLTQTEERSGNIAGPDPSAIRRIWTMDYQASCILPQPGKLHKGSQNLPHNVRHIIFLGRRRDLCNISPCWIHTFIVSRIQSTSQPVYFKD